MSKLFESRAAVLEYEARQRLVEKEIELARLTQPRQWQGLTDEELQKIYEDHRPYIGSMITAVAAKLREKNT